MTCSACTKNMTTAYDTMTDYAGDLKVGSLKEDSEEYLA